MKKLNTALLLLGLAFLVYLISNIGPAELWRQLISLRWGLIPLLLSEGVAEMLHTLGWRRCLSGPLRSLPFFRHFRIRMAGYAINYLTPTAALGGEITRAALLCPYGSGTTAVSGVLIDKASFAFGHLICVVIGGVIVISQVQLPAALKTAMVVVSALLAGGIFSFLLLQKYGKLGALVRWLAAHRIGGARLRKAAAKISEVDEAFKVFYQQRPLDLVIATFWHVVGFSLGILQTWLFFALMNQQAPFGLAATAWVLGLWFDLLTFAVPLNIGTLEGTRIVTFKALGNSALQGMTFGVTVRLAQVFWAVFGLAQYALLASKPARAIAKPSPRPAGTFRLSNVAPGTERTQ